MVKKITKAVICCGGRATRFAPISRTVPKEMLPIYSKPVIHYIVQELIDAGVTDILMLIGTDRGALQHYMDEFAGKVAVYYRRVAVPRGPADNIWHAKSFVGDGHFVVAYCDDVFFEGNPTHELIADFDVNGKPCLTAINVPISDAHRYGVYIDGKLVEKPDKTRLGAYAGAGGVSAAVGRYLLSPKIFELIEQEMPATDTEICFVRQLNKFENLRAVTTAARRFDTGTPDGLFAVNNYVVTKNGAC